ncbi:IS21 family transposase ISPpu7 [Sphingomonas sp. S2M10]|uniref:IS21 family transposase n=1 Tax=Sphingomonas sp. S2M10 TaxID=2705010 RepID=UPI001456B43C|nr:IS21 family transposase [Sphingomonas sp. S2M10]NLS29121.1 IS21 family transposase ISPpu7 [Sphingomonas sp. S2M10]
MRDVREVLKLHREGCVPMREVARMMGIARSTVRDMVVRFERSGLEWPVPAEISDADLEARLYGPAGVKPGRRKQPEPDWSVVSRELKRKHVTLQVLWEEYIAAHPDGYRYSRWCELFRGWEGRLSLVMRQSHAGGEKLFVDYAGDTVPVVINRRTGEIRDAHLFVAVLGGSSLSFACATWTEQFADWIEGHNAAFAFFGGVPQLLVPDNAKVAVIKACHFDPMLNRSYTDMARHYGTAVLPARPRRPRDKAKVEACVGIVERWVLGRLRNRVFYSLAELNAGIAECLTDLNETRILRQFGRTRRQLFEEVDAPNLKPLPAEPWIHAQWKRCRVGLDYHIAVDHHHYSVPHRFARREVEARFTARTVEIFLGGERIAVHMRGSGNGWHTTVPEHMPSSHRRYLEWTPAKIRDEAARIGPMLSLLVERIINDRPHPEQGYRSCLGIIGLAKRFGADRLEAAAVRALEIQARNYPSVKSILEKGLDKVPVSTAPEREPILHDNIRGSQYYH